MNSKVQVKVNEALCAKMEEILPEKLAEQVRRHHYIYEKNPDYFCEDFKECLCMSNP